MTSQRTRRAVLFDVGGVLFSPPQLAIAAYERELSLPPGALGHVFIHGAPDNAFCRLERGELTLSQFFPEFEKESESLAAKRGVMFPRGFSARELFQWIRRDVRPIPEMLGCVKLLRDSGYKTGAITNNWIDDTLSQSDRQLGSLLLGRDLFDVVLESCKVGLRKPDLRLYQMACKRLGVEPNEAVFLDDLGQNLKAARQLGMATIKVEAPRAALEELESLLGLKLTDSHYQTVAEKHYSKL